MLRGNTETNFRNRLHTDDTLSFTLLWQEFRWTGLSSSDRSILQINTLKGSFLFCQECWVFDPMPACTEVSLFWNCLLAAILTWEIFFFPLCLFSLQSFMKKASQHQVKCKCSVKHFHLKLGLSHWNSTFWQSSWGGQYLSGYHISHTRLTLVWVFFPTVRSRLWSSNKSQHFNQFLFLLYL